MATATATATETKTERGRGRLLVKPTTKTTQATTIERGSRAQAEPEQSRAHSRAEQAEQS